MFHSGWPETDLAIVLKYHRGGPKLGMTHIALPDMMKKVKKRKILMRRKVKKRNNLCLEG